MIGIESTEDLNKSFRKGNTPINTCNAYVKIFGENANVVVVALPSEMTTCGCKVKEAAVVHEVREKSSYTMVKNTASLVTRNKGFIKITYEHPRDINGLADVHEVAPEVRALSMVRASINAGAGSGNVSPAHGEGYRVEVGVKDGGDCVTG